MSLNMAVNDSNIKYEIIVSADISEELSAQIFRYWAFIDSDFKYPLQDFDFENNMTKTILEEIQENSLVKITLSHCTLCFNPVKVMAKNREEFIDYLSEAYHICDNCKMFCPNYDENIKQLEPLEVRLQQLDKIELKVLYGIIKLKKKVLIYQHIFSNDITDIKVWKIVNSLQRKDLIWIERDSNYKIIAFKVNPNLSQVI